MTLQPNCEFCQRPVTSVRSMAVKVTGWTTGRHKAGDTVIRFPTRLGAGVAHRDCLQAAEDQQTEYEQKALLF